MLCTLRALLELLRLPNLFTVPGDILVGWTASGITKEFPWECILASLCLYSAGLLFNDFFDAKIDAVERPARPIPSGRISRKTVGLLATLLTIGGLLLAWQTWEIVLLLAGLILAYDGGLKKIPIVGIVTMGACRGANILLGATALGTFPTNATVGFAVGVFTAYIVLVSLIARNEALPKLQHLKLPVLVSKLIRFLIPLQFLFCLFYATDSIMPLCIFFALLWLGAEVSGRRFSGS